MWSPHICVKDKKPNGPRKGPTRELTDVVNLDQTVVNLILTN